MNDLHRDALLFYNFLRKYCRGRDNAMISSDIFNALNIEIKRPNRLACQIKAFLKECGILIGSGESGYYHLETPEDAEAAKNYILRLAFPTLDYGRALDRWVRDNFGLQTDLNLRS